MPEAVSGLMRAHGVDEQPDRRHPVSHRPASGLVRHVVTSGNDVASRCRKPAGRRRSPVDELKS
jgi:hypothetical protein